MVDHDIVWLYITVHNSFRVAKVQCLVCVYKLALETAEELLDNSAYIPLKAQTCRIEYRSLGTWGKVL
jgi:hypothetical protein